MTRAATAAMARDTGLSDEVIVDRVRTGDAALFEVLMRRHNRRVYRAARAVLRNEAEVEDVMQQAYLAAFAHLSDFAGSARFPTWLLRITVNEALGRRRRAERMAVVAFNAEEDARMDENPQRVPDPERRAASRELATLVEAIVDGLPEMYRAVFLLREVEDLTTAEVAEVLGLGEDVVKTRLSRAKAAVRRELDVRIGSATAAVFPFDDPRCDRVVAFVMSRLTRV
jgi:RNA polymerase sigma-70 factor (ECF subfamily)